MSAQLALEQIRFARRYTLTLECLLWCPQHEMLHAGQIGLRRLFGRSPLW
jgi:hypothetical protein